MKTKVKIGEEILFEDNILRRKMLVKSPSTALLKFVFQVQKNLSWAIAAYSPLPFENIPYFGKLTCFHQQEMIVDFVVRLVTSTKEPFYADIHHQSTLITLLVFQMESIAHEIEKQKACEKGKVFCDNNIPYCDCEWNKKVTGRSCEGPCDCLKNKYDLEVIQNCSVRKNEKFKKKQYRMNEGKTHHLTRQFQDSCDCKRNKMGGVERIRDEVNVRKKFSRQFKLKKKMEKRVRRRKKKGKKVSKFERMFAEEDENVMEEMIKFAVPFTKDGMKTLGIKIHPRAKKYKDRFTECRKMVLDLARELNFPFFNQMSDDLCLYNDRQFWREQCFLIFHEAFFNMDKDLPKKRNILRDYRDLFIGPIYGDHEHLPRKRLLTMMSERDTKEFEEKFDYGDFIFDFFSKRMCCCMCLKNLEHIELERSEGKRGGLNCPLEQSIPGIQFQILFLHHYKSFFDYREEHGNEEFEKNFFKPFLDLALSPPPGEGSIGYETIFHMFRHPKEIKKSMKSLLHCAVCNITEDSGFNQFYKESIKREVREGEKIVLRKCGACRVTRYCSRNCQKRHWKKHKLKCEELKKQREDFDRSYRSIDTGVNFSHFSIKQ